MQQKNIKYVKLQNVLFILSLIFFGCADDWQYLFTFSNRKKVYVLGDGIPHELTGIVTVTDMYGNQQSLNAKGLSPSESSPIIVEP